MKKLNFGCGTNLLDGWENYDINPANGAKFIDLTQFPYPFEPASVDYIFVEHCLEHLPLDAFYKFLLESRRILKAGGVLRIAVPSVEKVFHHSSPQYSEFLKNHGWGDGSRESDVRNILSNHGHQLFFSPSTLSCILSSLGFYTQECLLGQSLHPELQNVEGHWKAIGREFAELETIVIEGQKV